MQLLRSTLFAAVAFAGLAAAMPNTLLVAARDGNDTCLPEGVTCEENSDCCNDSCWKPIPYSEEMVRTLVSLS